MKVREDMSAQGRIDHVTRDAASDFVDNAMASWPVQGCLGLALMAFGIWFSLATSGIVVGSIATILGGMFLIAAARSFLKKKGPRK